MVLDSRQWDARYGWDLLAQYAPFYASSVVITTPRAWQVVQRHFPHAPRHVEFHRGMSAAYVEPLPARLPDADRVLAIGGGQALDVGKYVAWKLGKPLVLIPTIVSTGAIFQPTVSVRHPGRWERCTKIVAPEYLLIDFGVVRQAPPHLNRAGMAECICYYGVLGSWRWAVDQGLQGPAWDQSAADATAAWVHGNVARFVQDLDPDGQLQEAGIRICCEVNRERWDLPTTKLGAGRNLDHNFVIGFEWAYGRAPLHGEGVALGSLISAYLYGHDFDTIRSLLDACRVRYRPAEIGVTHGEIRLALDHLNDYLDELGQRQNWFHFHQVDDVTLQAMLAAIEA
ncbi:MAG: iron-containing alcohol dehydrogenase [Actinobacteria bacterium]|nr:iron-containing alcohol dehydrogenase [Actinomycetota bacterium]